MEFASEEEAQDAFGKLAEGGIVKESLKPAFWGALYGQAQDKFGMTWMITNDPQTCRNELLEAKGHKTGSVKGD